MDKFSEAVKELVTKAGIASDKADYDRIKDEYIDLCWEAGIETIRNGTTARPANPAAQAQWEMRNNKIWGSTLRLLHPTLKKRVRNAAGDPADPLVAGNGHALWAWLGHEFPDTLPRTTGKMADIWSTGMLRTDSSPYYQALEVQTKNAEHSFF